MKVRGWIFIADGGDGTTGVDFHSTSQAEAYAKFNGCSRSEGDVQSFCVEADTNGRVAVPFFVADLS